MGVKLSVRETHVLSLPPKHWPLVGSSSPISSQLRVPETTNRLAEHQVGLRVFNRQVGTVTHLIQQ
jgi:hypothetical protein